MSARKESPYDINIVLVVKEVVSNYFHISYKDLDHKKRCKEEIAIARQLCHKLARQFSNASFRVIGELIGQRKHDNVMANCRTVNSYIETNYRNIRAIYPELVTQINLRVLSENPILSKVEEIIPM